MRRDADPVLLTSEQTAAASVGAKAMMPIAESGRPFLDYSLSTLADAGWTDVLLVVAPDHGRIRDYYTRVSPPRRLTLSFAVQAEPKGTADALLAAEAWTDDGRFLAVNGDNWYPVSALRALTTMDGAGTTLFARDTLVARSNIPPGRIQSFALCRLAADGSLASIVEKPDGPGRAGDLVSMNCWLMPPGIFEACRSISPSARGELEIADAVMWLIHERRERFEVVVSPEGVLDLSQRSDVASAARALSGVDADP